MQPPFGGLEAILEVSGPGAGSSSLPSPRMSPISSRNSSPALGSKNTLPLHREYSYRLRTGNSLTPRRVNSLTRTKNNPRLLLDSALTPRRVNSLTLGRASTRKMQAESALAPRRVRSLTLTRRSNSPKLQAENAGSAPRGINCQAPCRENSQVPHVENVLTGSANTENSASLSRENSVALPSDSSSHCSADGGRAAPEIPRSPHLGPRKNALLDVRKFFKLGSRLTPAGSPVSSPRSSPMPPRKYLGSGVSPRSSLSRADAKLSPPGQSDRAAETAGVSSGASPKGSPCRIIRTTSRKEGVGKDVELLVFPFYFIFD